MKQNNKIENFFAKNLPLQAKSDNANIFTIKERNNASASNRNKKKIILNQSKMVLSSTKNVLPPKETLLLPKKTLSAPQQIKVKKVNLEKNLNDKKNSIFESINVTGDLDFNTTTARNRTISEKNIKTVLLPLVKPNVDLQIKNHKSPQEHRTLKEMAEKFTCTVLDKEIIGLKKEFESHFSQKYQNKNINSDVPLLNNTRAILKNVPIKENYINANYVTSKNNSHRLIITQHPMKNTIIDFYEMINQENVQYIIQLANKDDFENSNIASEYIPKNKVLHIQNCTILNVSEEIYKLDKNIKITTLTCKFNGKELSLKHILWIKWPQNGCPNPWELTAINIYEYVSKSINPIIIHCTSGVRRSGIIAAIFMALDDFTTFKLKDSMIEIVKNLRSHRSLCIRNEVEYYFLHLQLINYFLKQNYISNTQRLMEFMDDYDPAHKKQVEIEKKKVNIDAFGVKTYYIK